MEINIEEGLARTGRVITTFARIIRLLALILGVAGIVLGAWAMTMIYLDDQGHKFVRMLDKADPFAYGVLTIVVTLVLTYIIKGFASPKQNRNQHR